MGRRKLPARAPAGPRSANIDPMLVQWLEMSQLSGTGRIGAGLPTNVLKALARTSDVAAIHQTFKNWGTDFAVPQPTPYSIGCRVVKADGGMYSPSDWRTIDAIMEVILRGGYEWYSGGLAGYVQGALYNTLTFDWHPTEVVREEGGRPWAYLPVDGATIRRAAPTDEELADYRWDAPEIAYQQVISNSSTVEVVNEFTRDELHVGVRRPSPAIERMGHGLPELEEFAGLIATLVNAITSNAQGVVSGIHSQLLIALFTKQNDPQYLATKNEIVSGVAGVRNNKRTLVLRMNPDNKEDIKTFPLGGTNESMQYMEWIDFLRGGLCAGYGVDPIVIFPKPGQNDVVDYNKLSPTARALQSKERGFRPLLRFISRCINEAVVSWWPGFRFEFVGFDSQSERDKLEMDIKAVTTYLSPNELRAARNLSPFDDPISNRPLNALYQTWAQHQFEQGLDIPALELADDNISAWVNGRRLPALSQPA